MTTKRVRVTPREGYRVRDPANPAHRIEAGGEVMLDSLALRRLESAGDITITDEAKPAKAAAVKKEG